MRVCVNCVLDESVSEITFDDEGVCNFCNYYQSFAKQVANKTSYNLEDLLRIRIVKIKREGQNNRYDCIIGLSGGVDSTYAALLAKKFGLRPLAVHFDNGWNSELAVDNITRIVKQLNLDLITYVVDWPEFREIQLAYFRSSVLDIEVPTDHFIFGALYKIAAKEKIKHIIVGTNYSSELILPSSWCYPPKLDLSNMLDIYKQFGGPKKIKSLPFMGLYRRYFFENWLNIKEFNILDFVNYNKVEAKKIIEKEIGWRDYGGKHYESIFTKFYQGYILPKKFKIDKRKAHLSNLILSGQISREQALEELSKPPLTSEEVLEIKEYVLKKWEISEQEFDDLLSAPPRTHTEFDSDFNTINQIKFRLFRILFYIPKKIKHVFWG